jgi:HK97 family phage portal protein
MDLISTIKQFLGRNQPKTNYWAVSQDGAMPPVPTMNSLEAELRGWGKAANYSTHDGVYSIVTMLIQKFASIPWTPYEVKDAKAFAEFKNINAKSLLTSSSLERYNILKANAVEVAGDSDLAKILYEPNEYQSFTDLMMSFYGYKLLYGEANIYMNSGNTGTARPTELEVLPTSMVGVVRSDDNMFDIGGYYLTNNGVVIRQIDKRDMISWKYYNPYVDEQTLSHLRGLSPLAAATTILEQSKYASSSLTSMFKNGGSRGALSAKSLPRTLTKTQVDQMVQDINQRINHNSNKGSIAALQGEWLYHNFGMNAVDMQLLDSQRLSLQRLCNIFNVPTVLFDAENTTYNNYESAIKQLVVNKLIPELVSARDLFNRRLTPRFSGSRGRKLFLDFDITEMPEIQKDLKDLNESVREAHWLSYNERRAVMRYTARTEKEMDYILLPQGYYPIQDLSALVEAFGANQPNNGDV